MPRKIISRPGKREHTAKNKRGSKRIITTLICVIAVIAVGVVCAVKFAPDILGLKQQHIHLKAGYSKYPYPPIHYIDNNGELIGFDIDLARAAGEIMNATIEFVPIDWSDRAELLESDEIDMLWGGLERATLDERKVKFTKSYLRSNIVLLMNDDRDYAKFEDLQGLDVCALNFTPAFYYLQVYNRDVIKSRRSYTPPNYSELFGKIASGDYDCMITDTSFASFYQRASGTQYKISDVVLASNYAVAVKIENTKLFDSLQNALDQLEADGTIADLRDKWIANS